MPTVRDYLVVMAVAAVTTGLITPLVRYVAIRRGAVVIPNDRHVHTRPVPAVGGAAMFVGLVAALIVAWNMSAFSDIFVTPSDIVGILVASSVMYAVGLLDDLRPVSAPAKTAGMVLAASVLSISGVSILFFRIPFFQLLLLSPNDSALLTVLWVVGIANAVNLIDGLDGLAAGIVGIAGATFWLYSMELLDQEVLLPGNPGALIAAIIVGLCVGFLPHNFHPAKIFMGDGGALLLGLLMAASTISVGGRSDKDITGQSLVFFAPIVIPLVILGVPLLDLVFAIVRHAVRRKGVATADREHLHHRLMRLGHGHVRTVLIMWAWTALLSVLALYPIYTGTSDAFVPSAIAALALLLVTVFLPGRASRKGEPDHATDAETVDVDA